LTNIHIETDA